MSSSDAPVPSCEVNYRTEVWTNSRPRPGRLLARAHPGFGAMWNRSLGSVSYPATLVPSLGGLASGGPLEQFAASARPTTSAGGGARGLVESLPRKCASSWTDSQPRGLGIGPMSGPIFDHASACGSRQTLNTSQIRAHASEEHSGGAVVWVSKLFALQGRLGSNNCSEQL